MSEQEVRLLLEEYDQWLYANGYVDADIWAEEPKAYIRFLYERNNKDKTE